MKKIVSSMLLSFCMLLVASCSNSDNQVYGIVYGDSLAYGDGVTEESSRLHACLTELTGKKFINLGKGGDTSHQVLDRLDDALSYRPKIAIVSAGGNDLFKYFEDVGSGLFQGDLTINKTSKYAPTKTFDNLREIYKSLKSVNAEVVHLGVSPPKTILNPLSIIRDDRLERIQEVAESSGAYYMPRSMEGLWLKPKYMADFLHPNNTGNRILCERIHEYLKEQELL